MSSAENITALIERHSRPIDVVLLHEASEGNPITLAEMKAYIQSEFDRGFCHVFYMDDTIAIVDWLIDSPFVIAITDPDARAMIGLQPDVAPQKAE